VGLVVGGAYVFIANYL